LDALTDQFLDGRLDSDKQAGGFLLFHIGTIYILRPQASSFRIPICHLPGKSQVWQRVSVPDRPPSADFQPSFTSEPLC
jgi:hypothetical protein